MNNKCEYNRCALPRLTAKLGEKDLEKWRKEDRMEMELEATIEEKIRVRKKERSKRRAEMSRRMEKGQPSRKRRKRNQDQDDDKVEIEREIQEEVDEQETTTAAPPVTRTETPKKRKQLGNEQRPPKKQRRNYDIKRYITCKRWRDETDKEEATTMEAAKDTTIITNHKTTMDNYYHITEGRLQGEDQESREEPGVKEDNTTTTSNTMDWTAR